MTGNATTDTLHGTIKDVKNSIRGIPASGEIKAARMSTYLP